MGFKRPFGGEFPDIPFKHPRQVENGEKLASFVQNFPYVFSAQEANTSGKVQQHEVQVNCPTAVDLVLSDRGFDISGPTSWVTSTSHEQYHGFGAMVCSPLTLDHSKLNLPQRALVPCEDIYSSFLDDSPTRQVPVGPNHQVVVPLWLENINDKLDPYNTFRTDGSSHSLCFNHTVSDDMDRFRGSCVLPMHGPSYSAPNGDMAEGRLVVCSCLDGGSVRCVREHVTEAREELRKTLGQERFRSLGFCDMGEAMADKWSKEEEKLFHQVVFSNPVSLAKNFWKQLSLVLPNRSRSDLVSYYFNVFMLQKRAAQNRSKLLCIDSDDDELHGDSYEVRTMVEDEDSAIESLVLQNDYEDHEEWSYEAGDCGVNDNDNDKAEDNNIIEGADIGECKEGSLEDVLDCISEANVRYSSDNCKSSILLKREDNVPGSFVEDMDVQDNSCTSFEFQHNVAISNRPVDAAGTFVKVSSSGFDVSGGEVGHMYIFEPSDSKVLDIRSPMHPLKDSEFLPTCNMIEEIFGHDSWDYNKKGS